MAPFTRDDALQAARIGASGIYHAALLRANGVPSGISYQVLTKGE